MARIGTIWAGIVGCLKTSGNIRPSALSIGYGNQHNDQEHLRAHCGGVPLFYSYTPTKKGDNMKSLTRYGTYGFMSALITAQVAMAPRLFAGERLERQKLNVKKVAKSTVKNLKRSE